MSEDATAEALVPTPGQTVGPFFHFALPYAGGESLVPTSQPGAIRLHGTVSDGHGDPIPDAMLEIWQADAQGNISTEPGSLRRDPYAFTGWGRAGTDAAGHFRFTTVNPGATDVGSAPFISVCLVARGLLNRLFTRAYLPEDAAALAADPLLSSLDEERRATLVGTREEDGALRFDVRLQGENETVFLQFPRQDA